MAQGSPLVAVVAAALVAVPGAARGAPQAHPPPRLVPDGFVTAHLYEGPLRQPGGMAVDTATGEIVVADTGNGLVGIFDRDGAPAFAFGAGVLEGPFQVAVGPRGRIYAVDHDRSRIRAFSYRGAPLDDLALPGLAGRGDVAIAAIAVDAKGFLLVAEQNACEIFVYDPEGRLSARFGGPGYEPGGFVAIAAIAADDEKIYIADQAGVAVQVFDRRGRLLKGWGEHTVGPEAFSLPAGIAVSPADGRIFVSDALRHEVKVFEPDGTFVSRSGGRGFAPGDFAYPGALAFDAAGRLLVLERLNGRVQRFVVRPLEQTGEILRFPGSAPERRPEGERH